MIVPMKKLCLAVQDRHRNEALERLREIGVVHVEKTDTASDKLAKAFERKARVEDAFSLIQTYKAPKKKKSNAPEDGRERRKDLGPRRGRRSSDKMGIEEFEPYSLDAINAPVRPSLVNLMNGFGNELKDMEQNLAALILEQGRIAVWGEFDPVQMKELSAAGQAVYLYELNLETFKTIPPETRYIKLGEHKETVYLAVFDSEIPNITPFLLPEKPLSQINEEIAVLDAKRLTLEERVKTFADRRPLLAKDLAIVERDIEFEETAAELEGLKEVPPEYGVSFLKGYAPAETMGELKALAAKNCWALAVDDPGPEDATPTELRNSRLVQTIKPLTGFLDLLPGYNEVDASAWFLLFLTIFFGMIFGDAGYGLLLFGAAVFGIIKTAKTGVPLGLRLLFLMSISNVAWGVITCNWFGLDAAVLPQFFRDISLSAFSTAKGTEQVIVNQNLQIFCFSLALIHLSIARIGGFIRDLRKKDLRMFAQLGSVFMLLGMFNLVLFLVVSNEARSFPLLPVSLFLLGLGFCLVFLFGYYEGSIPKSIVQSLKNIISIVLGITGIFSDIMSYIRLWAVSLAGASLAATINTLAGPLLGNFLLFLGIILLIFGHGLNIVLNTLSVLVHGVRLNILEFSGHAGLTWSGIAYKPFAETGKK